MNRFNHFIDCQLHGDRTQSGLPEMGERPPCGASAHTAALTSGRIRKAKAIEGKTLLFRDADIEDARFILELRSQTEKARHLSAISGRLIDQENWLAQYASDDTQAYFIIECKGKSIGTVRLYDPRQDSFCWGSWILQQNAPSHAAIESALMVYTYALQHLGFQRSHFDVRKENEKVWRFHERFGAQRSTSSHTDYFYRLERDAIVASLKRFHRYLDGQLHVEFK